MLFGVKSSCVAAHGYLHCRNIELIDSISNLMSSIFNPHGGSDSQGHVLHDFSTNANSVESPSFLLEAIKNADIKHYPDPEYKMLREALAQYHRVAPERVLVAGSASEFIFRISAHVSRRSFINGHYKCPSVMLPRHSYGDYAYSASVWGLSSAAENSNAQLIWLCDPSSPLGRPMEKLSQMIADLLPSQIAVLDLAYEPLRMEGALDLSNDKLDRVWQLWSPNKALGVTGIRGSYVIAPVNTLDIADQLRKFAPSWVLGGHGVEMLLAWTTPEAHEWLARSLETLRAWKGAQVSVCEELGWKTLPSVSNFFCINPQEIISDEFIVSLRSSGIKLRDTGSFGLANHFRLGVLPPASQQHLKKTVKTIRIARGGR
jgi:histidinol-phosphate aminotransferase